MKVVRAASPAGDAGAAAASVGAFSIQPENVTCLLACGELVGVCAESATVAAHTIAARIIGSRIALSSFVLPVVARLSRTRGVQSQRRDGSAVPTRMVVLVFDCPSCTGPS